MSRRTLEQMIFLARYAPSARNIQDTEWLVMGNEKALRQTAKLAVDWMR